MGITVDEIVRDLFEKREKLIYIIIFDFLFDAAVSGPDIGT